MHQASVQDLLVCTGPYQGSTNLCNGCQTIWPYGWWVSFGIVTGGTYNSSSGCMPYTSYTQSAAASTSSSSCSNTCTNPSYPRAYLTDRNKGYSYYIMGNGVSSGLTTTSTAVIDQIKSDLFTYGPMSVEVDVYDDFYHYSSGNITELYPTVQ
ncbi:hypothetical protein RvY_04468 [Ramazzottius varieornatus]|uniref:Peptidase C1A papain C-terminal domain-containing protein n=1 Tax=Ramazzottius varieornatus TaxID=947166 RepID=A0A1D1UXF6_RAMVA|nr:hypothetical protein RvY_04468 [Ramazzottius varieornatus]